MEVRKHGPRSSEVFSLCGRLIGHFPMCVWLHVACRILKRRDNLLMKGWDEEVKDTLLQRMMFETMDALKQDGDWCMDGWELNVWVDVSSLAISVVREAGYCAGGHFLTAT